MHSWLSCPRLPVSTPAETERALALATRARAPAEVQHDCRRVHDPPSCLSVPVAPRPSVPERDSQSGTDVTTAHTATRTRLTGQTLLLVTPNEVGFPSRRGYFAASSAFAGMVLHGDRAVLHRSVQLPLGASHIRRPQRRPGMAGRKKASSPKPSEKGAAPAARHR